MERRQLKPEVKSNKKRSASVLNCKLALKKDGSVSKTILTPYLVSLRGPILLSAAHSTKIMRGGKLTKTKERTHLREQWVSTIVLKVALEIDRLQERYNGQIPDKTKVVNEERYQTQASVLIWNKDKKFDKASLDPNYLVQSQLHESEFHQSLHKFVGLFSESSNKANDLSQQITIKSQSCKKPMFHIDIHGKKDRSVNREIDVGIDSLLEDFHPDDKLYFSQEIACSLTNNLRKVFDETVVDGFPVICNPDGELCGKWGGPMKTLTQQSVQLGIPAIQLEIPKSIRVLLVKDQSYLTKFASAILDTYNDTIVPLWQQKMTDLTFNRSLAKLVQETRLNAKQLQSLISEYREWDQKHLEKLI